MNKAILSKEVQEFITNSLDANIAKLALSKTHFLQLNGKKLSIKLFLNKKQNKITALVCNRKHLLSTKFIDRTNFFRTNCKI